MDYKSIDCKEIKSGKDLIKYIIDNNLLNYNIFVGCEGYTNTNEKETRVFTHNNKLFIVDNCGYEEKDL